MLNERINDLIKESMLAKNHSRTGVLRAIKDAFLVHNTAKNATPLDSVAELAILKRMLKQRNESATQYQLAGRTDLYNIESGEAEIIKEFIPAEATEQDIYATLYQICVDKGWYIPKEECGENAIAPQIPKKSMGEVIKLIKEKLPNADGKLVSDVVKPLTY